MPGSQLEFLEYLEMLAGPPPLHVAIKLGRQMSSGAKMMEAETAKSLEA